jgi:hypothetical protein
MYAGGRGLTLCEGLSFSPWWVAQLAEDWFGEGNGWLAVQLTVAGCCAGVIANVTVGVAALIMWSSDAVEVAALDSSGSGSGSTSTSSGAGAGAGSGGGGGAGAGGGAGTAAGTDVDSGGGAVPKTTTQRQPAAQQQQQQQQQYDAGPRAAEASATMASRSRGGRCLLACGAAVLCWLLLAYINAVVIKPTYRVHDPASSAVLVTGAH